MDFDELMQWVAKAEKSDLQRDERMSDYFQLVKSIDKLCGNSNSKLAGQIGELIDKHYEL